MADTITEHLSEFEQLAGVTLEGTDPADLVRLRDVIRDHALFAGTADADTESWLNYAGDFDPTMPAPAPRIRRRPVPEQLDTAFSRLRARRLRMI